MKKLKKVLNLLINLKNASNLNKLYCDCIYTKLILKFLNFLFEKGYILGYVFLCNFRIRIFLKYINTLTIFTKLKIYNKNFNLINLILFKKHINYLNSFIYIFYINSEFKTLFELNYWFINLKFINFILLVKLYF